MLHSINNGNWMWLSASAFFSSYFRVYSPGEHHFKTPHTLLHGLGHASSRFSGLIISKARHACVPACSVLRSEVRQGV